MRITLIGPIYPYRGGIAHHTTYLCQALRDRGHQVQMISFRQQFPAWLYPGKTDRDPSTQALQVAGEYILAPLEPWTWLRAAREVRSSQPDLVLIAWWTTFWAPAYSVLALLARQAGLPVVFLIHNVLPHEPRPWDHPLARLALGRGHAFLVQTAREGQRLQELLPGALTHVCPHPRYRPFTSRPGSRSAARQALGLPLAAPVLLFFGIVRPYKGLRLLLDALAEVKASGRDFQLVVAGEFWEDVQSYRQQIARLGLEAQVSLHDRYLPNEEVDLFFTAADLVVAPYTAGTQSGVASLALGYGRPLIVSEGIAAGLDLPDAADVRIVPTGDAGKLAEAIRDFLDHPPLECSERPEAGVQPGDEWLRFVEAVEDLAHSRLSSQPRSQRLVPAAEKAVPASGRPAAEEPAAPPTSTTKPPAPGSTPAPGSSTSPLGTAPASTISPPSSSDGLDG